MITSRLHRLARTPTLSCKGGTDALTRALLHRWKELKAAPPASATLPATELTKDTLTYLQTTTSPTSSSEGVSSSTPSTAAAAPSALFSSPADAQLIWRTLQRQRVPWQESLRLLPWQLQTMSAVQRAFVTKRISATPWEAPQIVLAAEDVVDDVRLVQQYRAMKCATHTVDLARLVSAALRERPDLPGGLLPVPYGVLLHAYTLGRRSPQEAAIMLGVSKHVTLLGRSALSRSAEERLVLGHAAVEGQVGSWQAALKAVEGSRAVRLSVRKGFERFVLAMQQRDDTGTTSKESIVSSSGRRSTDRQGGHPLSSAAAMTEKRGAEAAHISAWASALAAFLAQPPDRQTYTEARAVLAALPSECVQQPDYVQLASKVLRHAACRMYAGTFTRRFVSSTKKAEWSFALSLASAARCYDLAVPLIPLAPPTTKLPTDLGDFVNAMREIAEIRASSSTGDCATPLSLSRASAEALSYPQALAYALGGDASTRQTLLSYCPQSQPLSPLRSLLLATSHDVDGAASEIDCCTFQSASLSQLVCGAASEKRQRYFCKVLPASARAHHFCTSASAAASLDDAAEAPPSASVDHATHSSTAAACWQRLAQWQEQTASTAVACNTVMTDLSAYLRATHAIEGESMAGSPHAKPRLTEEEFLRWAATIAAWGTVQLPATERFHWPLAVLKAAWLLRVTLDASLISAAVRSIPSMFVDHATLALPSILNAHTLLGQWQAGLQICARLERKERDGTLSLQTRDGGRRPQTVKYTPPPPTLREAMAQVGYGAPPAEARRHWTALDASCAASPTEQSSPFALLMMELKFHGDARQLREELLKISASSSVSRRHSVTLERLSRRRMLLGAAFSLLDEEAQLEKVVRAGGQVRVRAEDLDSHGLQRLLGVLPAAAVCRVLAAEASGGRCAQEHWLLMCISQPELNMSEIRMLSRLRPTSSAVSAVYCARVALAEKRPVLFLKALRRVSEKALDSPARRALLLSVARLLRLFLAHDDLLPRCVLPPPNDLDIARAGNEGDAAEAKQVFQLAQMLFNRLQEVELLSAVLKHARQVVRRFISPQRDDAVSSPTSCATWVILSSLHVAVCRVLRLPLPASLTSRLLLRAVTTDASDWQAALFFFNELRHPTISERVALVQALRHCGGTATSLLLSHRRFMRGLPEQLMLWADEAGGPSKWERSIALLTQTHQGNEKALTSGTTPKSSAAQPTATSELRPANTLSPEVETAVSKWNADECVRAAQLLRRQGFVRMPAQPDRSLRAVRVLKTDPVVRRQVETILQILKKKAADAVVASTPRLGEKSKSNS